MSNDVVHIAKVSKIQKSSDIFKSEGSLNQRCMGRMPKNALTDKEIAARNEEIVNFHGSLSPRCTTMQSFVDVDSPDHTQRDTTESDNNISSCSTLDIVNKVENLSFHQLETQLRELTQRLELTEEQRSDFQRQLEESNIEKEQCKRHLEVVSAAHECRITEMHCVIAELSKKLRNKQECMIMEEQEPDDISYQEGSVYNSEQNLTNPDAECQTEPSKDAHTDGYSYHGNMDENFCVMMEDMKLNENITKGKMEALQEEVLHLKAKIALLQSEVAGRLADDDLVEENNDSEYYDEDVEADRGNCRYPLQKIGLLENKNDFNCTKEPDFVNSSKGYDSANNCNEVIPPIAKMAERVKLHCASKTKNVINVRQSENTKDIMDNSVMELNESDYCEPTLLENDLQKIQREIDINSAHNTVLLLSLNECKEHCEHLYLLCGKYESNAIALQAAVNYSDRAIEAYDVMLALLESKLVLMNDKSPAVIDSRRDVESVARHLLGRLESEKTICENSLGPWQNTFSLPDKACAPWTVEDDKRLSYHVSKLKGRRSTVQNTIVILESPYRDFYEKSRIAYESTKEITNEKKTVSLDIEMAVQIQELLSLREENINLKSKIEQSERENQYALDRSSVLEEALSQLQLQIQKNSNILFNQQSVMENRISYSEADHAALTEQQLVEALTRESELKGRIQTLIASVSATQKISDDKYEQLQNSVKELQKSNLSLNQLLEQSKRKYQSRIKKLEQKLMDMNMELGRVNDTGQLQQMQRGKGSPITKSSHHDVPETTL